LYVCLTHSKLTSLWFIFFTWLYIVISKISRSFASSKTLISVIVCFRFASAKVKTFFELTKYFLKKFLFFSEPSVSLFLISST